jgi:MFS family permease
MSSTVSVNTFTTQEKMAVWGIGGIFLLRMLGLFMLLPIFREYAVTLQGVTKPLMGITLGIYGLTQASFQIPFGFFSDRWGRRAVIGWGLVLFIVGSIIVAQSTHLYGVTIGRALQGVGAIGSVLMVYLSDLTREIVRPRAMAWVGMLIGISFVLALLLAPLLSSYWGVSTLFWGMAAAGIIALLILYRGLPDAPNATRLMMSDLPRQGRILFKQKPFLGALLAVFLAHGMLTALFLFLPQWIQEQGFTGRQSWHFYLPVFFIGFSGAMHIIRWTEKTQRLQKTMWISLLSASLMLLLLLIGHQHMPALYLGATGFFMAFGLLEAGLPAFVSTIVDRSIKGTAMGIYASLQFLGIFFGGLAAGLLL